MNQEHDNAHLQLHLHRQNTVHRLPAWLRVIPWLLTVLSANFLHYGCLLQARAQAQRSAGGSLPPLSFNLMRSPLMRLVRYRIKLLRYLETLVFLLLLGPLLPELAAPFYADWGMAEACLLGFLAGLITIFLNENKSLDMRTPWYPYLDFNSTFYGHMWDAVRVAGGSLLVPFEEELFYHSWMYRYFCSRLSGKEQHQSLLDVPFSECNWGALIATNGFMAIYNGKEWRSSGLSGLFSNWVIVRRGRFMDGVFAHAIRNITINIWVLVTDQRQFW